MGSIISEIEAEAEKILKEAEKRAQEIIDEAKRRAREIINDDSYRVELERLKREYEERIKRDVEAILSQAKIESELLWRKAQNIIPDIAKKIASLISNIEIE